MVEMTSAPTDPYQLPAFLGPKLSALVLSYLHSIRDFHFAHHQTDTHSCQPPPPQTVHPSKTKRIKISIKRP